MGIEVRAPLLSTPDGPTQVTPPWAPGSQVSDGFILQCEQVCVCVRVCVRVCASVHVCV